METELVSFPATNFYAQTKPTEKDIEEFYNQREADYRLPDRIQVNYVAFKASNYLAQVETQLGTNFNDHIDQEYLQSNPSDFKDAAGVQLSPEAAKARIKKQILLYTTMTTARTNAQNFLKELSQGHDDDHPYTPGDLAALAKTWNLKVRTTEPFDQKNGPNGVKLAPKDLHVLFALRDDDPDDKEKSELYASPMVGEDAIYVMGLARRIPSQIQPLSAVHDKVVADYREFKAVELAKAARQAVRIRPGGRFVPGQNL